jgi:uncharacterized OB-fold protein
MSTQTPQAKKKIAKAVRVGDWQCAKCGANVFATKSACFKCKTPKGSQG